MMPSDTKPPRRAAVVLHVDALHPTGHVGLLAALRAHGAAAVQPSAVCTAVRPFTGLPARVVRDQLDRALTLGPDAIGLGDPGDHPAALAEALGDALSAAAAPLIVAPNAVDRGRRPRFEPAHLATLAERLFRHAEAVALDTDEAALLTGREIRDLPRMRDAARRIADRGSRWVIVTGGRIEGHAVDLAWNGREFTEFGADRVPVDRQAGAGAVFGALLVAHRARGLDVLAALDAAKAGVGRALAHPTPVGPAARLDPLGPAFAALGLDPRPVEVPEP